MTRKSRRELERAVDEIDDAGGAVGYEEMMRYLETVADEGADADVPTERFGDDPEWGAWAEMLPAGDVLEIPGLDAAELTPPEIFAFRYCGRDVHRGVLEMRGVGRPA